MKKSSKPSTVQKVDTAPEMLKRVQADPIVKLRKTGQPATSGSTPPLSDSDKSRITETLIKPETQIKEAKKVKVKPAKDAAKKKPIAVEMAPVTGKPVEDIAIETLPAEEKPQEKMPEVAKSVAVIKPSDKQAQDQPKSSTEAAMTTEPFITDYDIYLLQEGTHTRAYDKLGAHPITVDGKEGVHFAVWAPNASQVSVVGEFNHWNGTENPMTARKDSGIWELFIPGLAKGALYKYEIHNREGHLLPQKADPFAFYSEHRPATASVVWKMEKTAKNGPGIKQGRHDPITIYEVHAGSWRRADGNRFLTYKELAEQLVPYVKEMGFTHIELMPLSEHPFDGSWGYQPIGLFSPSSRFGTPDDLRDFIDRAHAEGLGVLLDWVPGHFPNDAHGLAWFDGTHLYEHGDPREGMHQDWGTFIYNFGRNEVANFLLANARFWLDYFGMDGLRVDAVASMIYRNYSRKEGEWIPNVHGGVENLEATRFLRRVNEVVFGEFPGATTVAEESTSWPGVSQPTYSGGLGFGFKWNMGWMHDTLRYMAMDPVHRKYHHNDMTFGLLYGFSENFILPLSHDEVVHGKGSLISKMPGDEWQRFANLRAYFGFMFTHPGKKLLFMGTEFAQYAEWNHEASLDWHLLDHPLHRGMQQLVRDLNHTYRDTPALYVHDCEAEGFEWLESDASEASVLAYLRKGDDVNDIIITVCNFTPVVRYEYRVGVPLQGIYEERVNTDASVYGGSNVGNGGMIWSQDIPHFGRPYSLSLTLPPLATLIINYKKA